MFDFFRFFVLLLVGLRIFSAADEEDCPTDVCADPQPSVDENGKILMTVYYDNDDVNNPAQWSATMVRKACEAITAFPDKFSVEFVIGAGARVDENYELMCKADSEADRLEGCAAMILGCAIFPKFVCCNNTEGSAQDCIQKLGVDPAILNDCVANKRSDAFLIYNGDRRRRAGIPGCHVPEFAFNGIVDRCIKISTFDDLKSAICQIFERGDVSVDTCDD